MFRSLVVADTISPLGDRITTMELTYPRFIHSEMLTHRDRERNSGSSRAIPWPTMMQSIIDDAVVPIKFGAEKSGMITGDEIDLPEDAKAIWLAHRNQSISAAQRLAELGVHKSLCNRLTEPFMWITVVMTSTCWRNFFRQRRHPDAEIHMQKIAGMMYDSLIISKPVESCYHLPYIQEDDRGTNEEPHVRVLPTSDGMHDPLEVLLQVSLARCARVSYIQHGQKAKSIQTDLGLFDRLLAGSAGGHWSPFAHPAVAFNGNSGPYIGWKGYRKFFVNECPNPEGYP